MTFITKSLILFLLLTSFLHSNQNIPKKNVTLALSWKHQFQFAGYYMAKELGYYDKAGLNVSLKEFDLSTNLSKEVSEQTYEFGISHSSLLLDKLNNYPNLVLLNAINQSSPLVLISKQRQDLSSVKDILGKKIQMSNDKIFDASINAMLLSEKIKFTDYKVSKNDFKLQSLIRGETDLVVAYASNEPFSLDQKGVEYTIFDPKEYGYDFYSDILFTSAEMIKNDKETVDKFRQASLLGWKYAYEHIDETIALILQKYNTQSKTKKALLYEATVLKELAYKEGITFGYISKVKLHSIVTTLRLLGLVNENATIDYDACVYQVQLNDTSKKHQILETFFKEYKEHILLVLLIFTFIVILNLYYRHKTKLLLDIQSEALAKNLKIFDEHVSASRTDVDGNITYVTQAFCQATGYTKEQLLGKNHRILRFKGNTHALVYKDLWMSISTGHTWDGELKNINKDGSVCWIRINISPIFNASNTIVGYEGIREDITVNRLLKEFNKELKEEVNRQTLKLTKLANTDKLTGIYNRVKIDEVLENNFSYFVQNGEVFSVIIIDIDLFKNVNDSYGHQVGDIILKEMAKTIKAQIRSSDVFGRWGGEEFMIICPNTAVLEAHKLAQKIRKSIQVHHFPRVDKVTISAGLSDITSTQNIDSLIKDADEALYRAKENGRNRVESKAC